LSFWCASKAGGSCVLLVEVIEMLWLLHVGVDNALGVSLTGFVEAALGGV